MRLPPDTLHAVEIRDSTLAGIVDGRIDLAFRRWEKPRVKAGGRQRTAVGVIGFDAVDRVPRSAVTAAAAHRAGFASRQELLGFLDRRSAGQIYRIELRVVGPDPRVALRDQLPDATDLAEIERRLARLDRASPARAVDAGRAAGHRGQPRASGRRTWPPSSGVRGCRSRSTCAS